MTRVGCVLLAAGRGVRFGGNKLLHAVEGRSLFDRAMDVLPPGEFAAAVAVCSAGETAALAAARGYCVVRNDAPADGLARSVRLGLSALPAGLDGALFAVCDQPFLTAGSVARLLAAFAADRGRIAALSWRGRPGNPVVFPGEYFDELAALEGDCGGRVLLRRHPQRVTWVEAASAAELEDMDESG